MTNPSALPAMSTAPGRGPLVGTNLPTARSPVLTDVHDTPSDDRRTWIQQPLGPSLEAVHPGPPTATTSRFERATATGDVSIEVAASAGIVTVHGVADADGVGSEA